MIAIHHPHNEKINLNPSLHRPPRNEFRMAREIRGRVFCSPCKISDCLMRKEALHIIVLEASIRGSEARRTDSVHAGRNKAMGMLHASGFKDV